MGSSRVGSNPAGSEYFLLFQELFFGIWLTGKCKNKKNPLPFLFFCDKTRRAGIKSSRKTHLVGNGRDEGLNVQLGGTALLAWSISALQTTGSFSQGPSFAQGGVLDITEVVLIVVPTTLKWFFQTA